MQQLHARTPSRAPLPPAGLTTQRVRFGAQLEAARSEWFLPGTAQESFAINSIADNDPSTLGRGQKSLKTVKTGPAQATRITAPADGTILALDPDIPPTRQRVRFTADAPMTVITNIEDLRVLAQKRVPRMFYDYADSGSLDRGHLPRQRSDFQKIKLRQRVAVNMETAAPQHHGGPGRGHAGGLRPVA
jgi:hypothetical protein